MLDIASHPIDTDPTFTVGADVSRFQRSSVPAKTASTSTGPQVAMADKPAGPVVKIRRGSQTTDTPVGGK